jgi:hypothetical protein
MKRGLALTALVLLAVVATTAHLRYTFYSETPVDDARLSRPAFPPLTRRLVILLVDSIPFDMAWRPGLMPFVSELRKRGTWGSVRTEEPTMTGQMVYTIASGVRPFAREVARNWRQGLQPHETMFDAWHGAGQRVEVYGDAPWTEQYGDRLDVAVTVAEEGRRPDGQAWRWRHAVNDQDAAVLPALDRTLAAGRFDVLVWHVMGTDLVMHKFLRDSALTADKIRYADLLVEGVVRTLDDGQTTFLLLSDHGCEPNGRHGYDDPGARNAFFVLVGPRVVAGQRRDLMQVDLAPTLLALTGHTPGAPSTGRPLVEALAIPAAERARIALHAAENRAAYLALEQRRFGRTTDPQVARVAAARAALAQGDAGRSLALTTRYLRDRAAAALAARRERGVAVPLLHGLLMLGLLGGLAVLLYRTATPAAPLPRPIGLGLVLAGLAAAWALGLWVGVWNGRWMNQHFDVWPVTWQLASLAPVVLLVGLIGLVRQRIVAAARAHPGLALIVAAGLLALLPGFFQGLYAPAGLIAATLILLLVPGATDRRPWVTGVLGIGLLVGAFIWEWSWKPLWFLTAYLPAGRPEAAVAGLAYLITYLLIAPASRPASGDAPAEAPLPRWPGLLLAAAVAATHLAWTAPPLVQFATSGDALAAIWPGRTVAACAVGLLWLVLGPRGLAGPRGAALGALAVVAAFATPYEAAVLSLLTLAISPLRRLAVLDRPGLAGPAVAALILVAARIVFQQAHEFHLNFTVVHQLFRFAPDVDAELWPQVFPVALRYTLPALVLVPLLWGRLSPERQVVALQLTLLFVIARVLHLAILARLTVDQLYQNWRGMGELMITGFWALGLGLAFALWRLGQAAYRVPVLRPPGAPVAPGPAKA